MHKILDNIKRKKREMSGDKVLIGQNVAAGIAAMREGVRSPAWEFYMTQFARDDDGTLDKAKLARLMGSDGTLGDPIMDRKRAYLVANSICGDTTYTFLEYGCASIDDGINGAVCDRFESPCDDKSMTVARRATKSSNYGGKKKARRK